MSYPLSISTIGDISFEGQRADKPSAEIFLPVASILKSSDLTVANLENPLTQAGNPVKGKCTLRGNHAWAGVMKEVGIYLVTLANNHMMDYGSAGLLSTINALENSGLHYVGAGNDKNEACAPAYINIKGMRVAFLGRTSVIVSSPSYAEANKPGVAFLDVEETKNSIRLCKEQADVVILLIHWGLEEYFYPSPNQRTLARQFIESGVDLILGHHPHVLEGIESIGNGLVCYSLGNFIFNDIHWSFVGGDGKKQDRVVALKQDNRKGGIMKVGLSGGSVESYDFIPTSIHSDGTVFVDDTQERKREFDRLCSRLQWPAYSLFWRLYSMRQEWRLRIKPLMQEKLTWAKLRKLRPKHFKQLLDSIRRSTKITAGKTTNPYE